jgi:4-hydroxybutyrate dehydrogenase/sulfolactaldehyde 3-reductase
MTTVGFIGLGQMGAPMSRNLMKKGGHKLRVYDATPAAIEALVKDGSTPAKSPKDAAKGAAVVFTMLPIGSIVEEVVFGVDGIVEGIARDALYIDMSTILPADTDRIGKRLAARGIAMVDAPVGRTSAAAVAGTSTFMVGGAPADVARARPYLEAMGEAIVHCGPLGTGARMKLVNNYMSCVLNLLTAEALTMAEACGIPVETALEVLRGTPAGRGHINTTWPNKALKGDATPEFMLDLAFKDLGLALETAAGVNVPLATGAVARQMYALARAQGRGRDDWTTAIYHTVRRLAGTMK